ncbi:PP2C family protein-serine/threonine phosphatase [Dasania marina]|uniref:PP2C family protein-serine/threonine phosphatase n=1 Tax=Dasania marina TaxID=471499 RepID=UPI00035C3A77|nr:protein phosphatase 2C domain-containing protein [Dasania marina]
MTLIEFDAKTDTGVVRDHNEDAILADANAKLWVVADGMGGHACGEVASAIVLKTIKASAKIGQGLVESIQKAHADVKAAAESNINAKGMGSTVVAMSYTGNSYTVAWVGDSRAYRLRKQKLQLLTRDHSYLELLKDNGLTEEAAREHPKRNIIVQAVGVGELSPDTVEGEFKSGDRYLLCSDGLNDELADDEIETILNSEQNTPELIDTLVERALHHGGRDNVSVIVIDIDPEQRRCVNNTALGAKLGKVWLANKPVLLPLLAGMLAATIMALIMLALR